MQQLSHTDNAADLISGINSNLQEMGSVVELTTSASATQLVDALNAEFANVSGATELSTSMTAAAFVEALNGNFSLADGGIVVKEKFRAELADTIDKVNELDTEDGLVMLLCTDIHYNCTNANENPPVEASRLLFDDSVVNMKALMEDVDADAVLCLGDIIDGSSDLTRSRSEAAHMMANFDSLGKPVYIALGNHDNNKNGNGYTQFEGSEMKTLFMSHSGSDVTYPNPDTLYKSTYYKDFDAYKLRLIFCYSQLFSNGATYEFTQATREFIASSLESLPNGYKAIFVTHVPPITKMNYNNRTRTGGESGDTTINGVTISGGVKGIIQHYGDKVIATLYGHCHQDNVWADPFVCIGTCCNKSVAANGSPSYWSEDAVMPSRSASNHTQDLWDVVLVKPTAKVIEMVRFGAGADRTIHYEPVECAPGSSATLTSKMSGGTWGLRTSDQSKASVANGVVTVGSGIASGTLLSVWCKSSDWAVNSSRQLTAGSSIEYWTIKVINT